MYLKKYQERVVSEFKHFLEIAKLKKQEYEKQKKELEEKIDDKTLRREATNSLNYVGKTFENLSMEYHDRCRNGLGSPYPRVTIKVPTGGGKTLLAVEAIKTYQRLFAPRGRGLVVWVVPKEIIYTQTINRLRDKAHPYRQFLDNLSGNNTLIKEKGQKLSRQDIEQNLVVLFIMIQSVSRNKSKEALKVFQDSGGYENFFPQDNLYDLHGKLLGSTPNLDTVWHKGKQAQLITSLGNAIRVSKPFVIIDEIHKVFTENAKNTIDNLNPELVLGLSATPKKGMNILCTVSGIDLKDEDMIKLDMHIYTPAQPDENDWKGMIRQIKARREALEQDADAYRRNTAEYIRPIALIQVERTGKDQRGKGFVHSEDVKEYLIQSGVNVACIAIKSSVKNDIADINLLSSHCEIRYIITKEALKEGWDCPFAYILGIIPSTKSNASVTQLIGRILRQPRVKKTQILALDESYVYYTKGASRDLLESVEKGFKQEGLEDLITSVKTTDSSEESKDTRSVGIKKELIKYNYAFYLPVWLMIHNKESRKFNYHTDIRRYLNFRDFTLDEDCLRRIEKSLSPENAEHAAYKVGLSEESKFATSREEVHKPIMHISREDMIQDLTRRYTEVVVNTFLARKITKRVIDTLISALGEDKLANHFNHIACFMTKDVKKFREQQEESLFSTCLDKGVIELAVSDKPKISYKIPEGDIVNVTAKGKLYKNYLYEELDAANLNRLEEAVVEILEKQDKLLWWFRNKVAKGWYAIQGWREHKIRPDFVVAKRKDDDSIDVLYILESKGEHLQGNPDSVYKKKVMDRMTDIKKKGNIKAYQTDLFEESKLNTSIEAHFVEGDTAEIKEKVGILMK